MSNIEKKMDVWEFQGVDGDSVNKYEVPIYLSKPRTSRDDEPFQVFAKLPGTNPEKPIITPKFDSLQKLHDHIRDSLIKGMKFNWEKIIIVAVDGNERDSKYLSTDHIAHTELELAFRLGWRAKHGGKTYYTNHHPDEVTDNSQFLDIRSDTKGLLHFNDRNTVVYDHTQELENTLLNMAARLNELRIGLQKLVKDKKLTELPMSKPLLILEE